ncbi:hypothetical protein L484_023509 [Morus notabilis]|uniref:Leucine-rich repeat-containing N-terminal plant-type domain-containing protein n=1 Tax=Morus notabilis TaxID=981085 RepID=W9RHB6_9ROSA|nr:hypothetical protein L484_023509 [Morus notabilis]
MKLENPSSSFAFWSLFLRVILLYFASISQPTSTVANALGNETDRFARLKFKEMISNDPFGVMSSWNDSVHFRKWPGISCGRRHQRITALDLQGYNLRGLMSPYVGNLSFLRFIDLTNNSFFREMSVRECLKSSIRRSLVALRIRNYWELVAAVISVE